MSEVLDFYLQQAKGTVSTTPWVADLQQAAVNDLTQYGFPTRHVEDWKYTVLDSFLQQRFLRGSHLSADRSSKDVLIKPLSDMIRDHEDLIKPYLGQILQHEHGIHALNTAMLSEGTVIYLPSGAKISEPIVLRYEQNKANQSHYLRHLIIAEPDSHATIIEEYVGEEHCVYYTNVITEIALAARAKITHYKIQNESRCAFHMGHVAVWQGEASEFASHSLSLGGQLVRSDLNIALQEENASCLMNGIYIPGDKQHIDHHTRVNHLVANCRSDQDYKGILKDHSRAVFNGQVIVAHGAQKTQAHQQNKNLLLSKDAEIDTKPQLEIDADDVICSHGATVGQFDEDAVFYLSSRGMDKQSVERYLIQAFVEKNRQLVDDVTLRDWMMQLINEKLGMIEND
jgi:Fe-S cluster assembly protein SufD